MLDLGQFLQRFHPSIAILSGDARGVEFPLTQRRSVLGRGPGADLALGDATLLREHAVVEFRRGRFQIRVLSSGTSLRLNGAEVSVAELENGTQIELGRLRLQFVLSEGSRAAGAVSRAHPSAAHKVVGQRDVQSRLGDWGGAPHPPAEIATAPGLALDSSSL